MIQTVTLVGQRQRYNNVMNDDFWNHELFLAFEFAGMDRFEARKAVVKQRKQMVPQHRNVVHSVGHLQTYRCYCYACLRKNVRAVYDSLAYGMLLPIQEIYNSESGKFLPTSFQRYLPLQMRRKMSMTSVISSALVVTKFLLGAMPSECMSA